MITELIILVEGVVMGRVFEQTHRGGTLSFQYDPGWIELIVCSSIVRLPDGRDLRPTHGMIDHRPGGARKVHK